MLASITPLGERGRQSRWVITVSAFMIGATAAGAAAGALLGWAGALLIDAGAGSRTRLMILTVALIFAWLLEAGMRVVPGPRRQVNERWLDEFRGWVYGLGFGAQLGLGITTVVSSAATYVALLAAFLSGDAVRGALVLGLFGAVRGATPLLAARVHRPEQLRSLHLRLERLSRLVAPASVTMLLGMALVAGAGSLA